MQGRAESGVGNGGFSYHRRTKGEIGLHESGLHQADGGCRVILWKKRRNGHDFSANASCSAFGHPGAQRFPHSKVQYVQVMSVPSQSVAVVSKDEVKIRMPVHGDRKLCVCLLTLRRVEKPSPF